MARWAMLMLVVAALAAAGTAHHEFAERAPVREAVATTQWAVAAWAVGGAILGAALVGAFVGATLKLVRWRFKVFNPIAILVSTAIPIVVAGWTGYGLLVSVPERKLDLLVEDLLHRDPKLLANVVQFADLISSKAFSQDLGFLRGFANCGGDFLQDGKGIVDQAASPYEHPSLADSAADRLYWGTVTQRITLGDSILVISGSRDDFSFRQSVRKDLNVQRQQLRDFAAKHGGRRFLRDTSDRFDDIVSRIQIQEPMPKAIDDLTNVTSKLSAQTDKDLVGDRVAEHQALWKDYITAIAPALDAIADPDQAVSSPFPLAKQDRTGTAILALTAGMKLFGEHANSSKKAKPAWWVLWKEAVKKWVRWKETTGTTVVEHEGLLPSAPFKPLDRLGVQGRNQRNEVDKKLTEFRAYVEKVLEAKDDILVEPPDPSQPGLSPGSWTPAGVEALVKEKMGFQRWSGQTYPNGHEVLTVIQSGWVQLWVKVTPQSMPNLSDAVRAAQGVAMIQIKIFLRKYRDDLQVKIAGVKKSNYQDSGKFREPFRTTPPFNDDNERKRLRDLLIGLKFDCPSVETVPTPPAFAERIACTKDACAMAEKAVECFDRICGDASKPGDPDWRDAGLWYQIFFGGPGDKEGFNPFDAGQRFKSSTSLKGTDGKDLAIGGLTDTDDNTLRDLGQPKPAVAVTPPAGNDKPPVK